MTIATPRAYHARPFRVEDVELMRAQARQADEYEALRQYGAAGWAKIAEDGRSFSGFEGDRILGFAGLIEYWPTRWMAWSVLSDTVDRYDLLWIHRTFKAQIDALPSTVKRLEVTVLDTYAAGHRWAQAMGFKKEGLMEAYDHFGHDHAMYVRIRE